MNITGETVVNALNSWYTFLAILLLAIAFMVWTSVILTTRVQKKSPQVTPSV